MSDPKNGDRRGIGALVKNAWRKWLTDPNKVEQKELTKTDEPTPPPLAQKPLDDWQYRLLTLWLPEDIVKRAESYAERQKFLARTDEENLELCQEKKQFIDHKFDKISTFSFWGSIVALGFGGISAMFGGPVMFWAVLTGLGAGSTYVFDRLAQHAHLAEMEIERQNALEECEDKLNQYAHLLVEAVHYINAQIELWNKRVDYLLWGLAEPTDQDRQHCKELRNVREDFKDRVTRLYHFYELRQTEKNLAARGLDMERLHSKLNEHIKDLKPIVPQISTDPLMLEAINEMNTILEEHPTLDEAKKSLLDEDSESAEIVIEEDVENK